MPDLALRLLDTLALFCGRFLIVTKFSMLKIFEDYHDLLVLDEIGVVHGTLLTQPWNGFMGKRGRAKKQFVQKCRIGIQSYIT